MGSIAKLRSAIKNVRDAIDRNAMPSASSAAGKTSDFWAEVLAERPNYPDLNGLMTFRREGFAYGTGDDRQGNVDLERNYSERMHHIFRHMVSAEFVDSMPESTFGAPLVFEHDGICRSASFWINAATTRRVVEFMDRFGSAGPIRVLEIGAGWGACAYQLHHALDVESYTITDLAPNLYISTIYLSTTLPDRQIEFIDITGDPINQVPKYAISAFLPGAIGRVRAKYDLILNSFSLQEMALESVQAYIEWIGGILADDGIFVSLNSHAKAGVKNPGDYRYDTFHIHHWGVFRKCPPGFLNTIPYEVVVGKRRPDSPAYPRAAQDGLGWLMQLGLDHDLAPLCDGLVRGTLDDRQFAQLQGYGLFFSATSDAGRSAALGQMPPDEKTPIFPYVCAHLALVRGDHEGCRAQLEEASRRGLSGFARTRAEVLLAGFAQAAGRPASLRPSDGLDPRVAFPEVAAILSSGDVSDMINQTNRVLRRTPQ